MTRVKAWTDCWFGDNCIYDDHKVDANARETWQRMDGWARKGQAGGSDVRGRKFKEGWAHDECLARHLKGLDGQGPLF